MGNRLITGPVEATIIGPTGRVYDLTSGIIEIDADDHAYVVDYVANHFREAAEQDPGSWCMGGNDRHQATPVELPNGDIVNWLCSVCTEELTKNAHGWWTLKPVVLT